MIYPVSGQNIQIDFPVGFAAEEIVVLLEPEEGLAPELSDVAIIACLGMFYWRKLEKSLSVEYVTSTGPYKNSRN